MKNMFALLALSLGVSSLAQAVGMIHLPAGTVITTSADVTYEIGDKSAAIANGYVGDAHNRSYEFCELVVKESSVKTGLKLKAPIQFVVSAVTTESGRYIISGTSNKFSAEYIRCSTNTIEKFLDIAKQGNVSVQIPLPIEE